MPLCYLSSYALSRPSTTQLSDVALVLTLANTLIHHSNKLHNKPSGVCRRRRRGRSATPTGPRFFKAGYLTRANPLARLRRGLLARRHPWRGINRFVLAGCPFSYFWSIKKSWDFRLLQESRQFYFYLCFLSDLCSLGLWIRLKRRIQICKKGLGCPKMQLVWDVRKTIVEVLFGLGARVHFNARNNAELYECLEQWRNRNIFVTRTVCDERSRPELDHLMETVTNLFKGKLNILVNNATWIMGVPKGTLEVRPEEFSNSIAGDLESVFHLSQLCYPLLKNSSAGNIVFISSIAGGINQLTRSLAVEWAKDNIRYNCIAPGPIQTQPGPEVMMLGMRR